MQKYVLKINLYKVNSVQGSTVSHCAVFEFYKFGSYGPIWTNAVSPVLLVKLLQFRGRLLQCYHYRNLLMRDLCTYYEYNEFLMGQLMELMPFGELLDMLGY